MENSKMDVTESIEIISRMICNTRRNIERSSYRPFLIWGYTTIIVALAVWFCVGITQDSVWFWLWFAIPVIGCVAMYLFGRRSTVKGYVRTPIDRAISYLWIVLGLAGFIASIFSFVRYMDILFLIVLLMASGTAITGFILQFRVLIAAGLAGLILSVLFLFIEGIDQCLIFAAIFFVMTVVPGHIIQYRLRKTE